MTDTTLRELSDRFTSATPPTETLHLQLERTPVIVRSNSRELLEKLEEYFTGFRRGDADPNERPFEVTALECPTPDLGLPYVDWRRDPGKVGRKDTFCDLADGRVLRKVRTGMHFLISAEHTVAFGPCLANDNQVVNFINALWMNRLLAREWILCHAAAVDRSGVGLAIAGFSGGGKSTLALHLLETGTDFVSNDRLLIAHENGVNVARGVPKYPRINPGTALNHPALRSLLTDQRIAALEQMPVAELWDLEEKYDAFIGRHFPTCHVRLHTQLRGFYILNWKRDSSEPTRVEPVRLADRRDLLAAVVKSAGPFHVPPDAPAPTEPAVPADERYLAALEGVQVFELVGRVDFEVAAAAARKLLSAG